MQIVLAFVGGGRQAQNNSISLLWAENRAVQTTSSNIDKYPVSYLGFPGSWFKAMPNDNNTQSAADIVITRFVVTDIQTGLNVDENVLEANQMHIYPNPTNGSIRVQLTNEAIKQIDVVDMNGRLVFNQTYTDAPYEISLDLGNLAAGMYFINANNTYHAKISKL